ncbi:hypothetical protein [Candidatus Methylomicrobium oryzae]|jgi:hypothetical protein|uniref:hypothetical protein n=1 Tax=Candidatus Methylomicrobium oryzae TaxID=2802053 RepID=UPI001921AD9C|nr:hypothetical protein [Methylomicrobium sp. RS1]MBL1263737.1 hypothetical protein [Methylomicrobium sp. RS1]
MNAQALLMRKAFLLTKLQTKLGKEAGSVETAVFPKLKINRDRRVSVADGNGPLPGFFDV